MGNRIIRMTQDLLDRGYELNNNYIYGIKCFEKNIKIMAENNDPAKKAKNLNSNDLEARACTRLKVIDEEPDTSMNLVLETPTASDEISNDLTPDPKMKYGPQGLLIHSTGAAQSSAQSNVNTFNSVLVTSAGKVQSVKAVYKGTHAFVAPNDIVQCLPWNFMAHHCAGFFNYTHIGLDLVEPDNNEQNKEQFVLDTYETMVELAAYLCEQYKLDPMGFTEVMGKNKKTLRVPVILSHKEAHALGGASNHGDPDKMWKAIKIDGVALTMDKFRAAVKKRKGKVNFYYVTDKWEKQISTGKKLPDKMVYTKGEKAGGRIDLAKYPYELGKINLEERAVTIPTSRNDERWFPKTYPLHKPGYRAAYNDRTAADIAARIAVKAAHDAGDIDKRYNVYHYIGDRVVQGPYVIKIGRGGPMISFDVDVSTFEKPNSAGADVDEIVTNTDDSEPVVTQQSDEIVTNTDDSEPVVTQQSDETVTNTDDSEPVVTQQSDETMTNTDDSEPVVTPQSDVQDF